MQNTLRFEVLSGCLCEEGLTGGAAYEKGTWSTLADPENEGMGRIRRH